MSAQPVIRSYEAKIDDVRPDERAVISKIGGMAIDRHRTIISHTGIALDAYRKNPIVLHEHGRCPTRGSMPVGRNQWIKVDGDRLIAKTIFRDDAYSIELFNAYKDEWLRGWSINVLAHEAGPPTEDEMRAAPAMRRDCDLVYRKTELVEYSTTAMPSHRDALTLMVSRGIWVPDEAMAEAEEREATATVNVPLSLDPEPRTITDSQGGMAGGGGAIKPNVKGEEDEDEEEEPEAEDQGEEQEEDEPAPKRRDAPDGIARFIRKRKGRFVVLSESGKLLGTHDSRADAEKQLAAIEAHKHDEGERSAPPPDPEPSADDEPIRHDGHGGWTVRGVEGVSFPDEATARQALAVAENPPQFASGWASFRDEIRRRNERLAEDLAAHLDLRINGRV